MDKHTDDATCDTPTCPCHDDPSALPDEDRLYNRVLEHDEGEHVTSWAGCPVCERDAALEVAVRDRFGI